MRSRNILILVAALILGSAVGFRHTVAGLSAQASFNGVTVVQKVYYNCTPGQSGCEVAAIQTDAYDSGLAHVTMLATKGDLLPTERLIDIGEQQIHVFPAVNEYFTLNLKRLPARPPDTTGQCTAFLQAGMVAAGTRNIGGYRALRFKDSNGLIVNYLPDLGCVSIVESASRAAQPGQPPATTIYVPESITPSVDRALFAPNPGMVETLPSKALHD